MYQNRLHVYQAKIASSECDGMYVIKRANIRYLTGYTGDGAFLLISDHGFSMITDSRYLEQAQTECPFINVILYDNTDKQSLMRILYDTARKEGIRKLGYEYDHIMLHEYQKMEDALGDITLVPISGSVEEMRRTKDAKEIEWLREACSSTDHVFEQLLDIIHIGMTEKELEWKIMHLMQLTGNGNYAEFATLSGVNGSYPHGKGSYTKKIEDGDFITMDFGCKCNGYHADMTRTVHIGQPSARQQEIYEIVREAQAISQAAVAPGMPAREIDRIGRDFIREKGYGKYFGHGMGHGVGLEIHEIPFIRAGYDDVLRPYDVITVEPGIYIPGWGGIRIEDTILVTENGHESLFKSSKKMICL